MKDFFLFIIVLLFSIAMAIMIPVIFGVNNYVLYYSIIQECYVTTNMLIFLLSMAISSFAAEKYSKKHRKRVIKIIG